MRTDPVGQPLAGQRLGVGVVGCPQHGDEDLRLPDFTRLPIHQWDGHAAEVHEQLLARPVRLPHYQVAAAPPGPVGIAESGILEAVRVGGLVLLPEQEQRHALAPQLLVDVGPVRQGSPVNGDRRWWRE